MGKKKPQRPIYQILTSFITEFHLLKCARASFSSLGYFLFFFFKLAGARFMTMIISTIKHCIENSTENLIFFCYN